jgi:arginase family enzyme
VPDPAFAPRTDTPVRGGLAAWRTAAILRGRKGLPILGCGVVEVSPPCDRTCAAVIAGAYPAEMTDPAAYGYRMEGVWMPYG